MVALTRARGIDARVGDAQALAFADDSFDLVIAAWMLYHVPDLDRGLREIARVLRPGGALVATTNSTQHLSEMWTLVGLDGYPLPFNAENGAAILGRHFAHVEQQDISGSVTFPDRDAIRRYVASSIKGRHLVDRIPETAGPLSARWRCCILRAW
jgi:SAM-dependent methyltransferase